MSGMVSESVHVGGKLPDEKEQRKWTDFATVCNRQAVSAGLARTRLEAGNRRKKPNGRL
jgi:hypothetical protein